MSTSAHQVPKQSLIWSPWDQSVLYSEITFQSQGLHVAAAHGGPNVKQAHNLVKKTYEKQRQVDIWLIVFSADEAGSTH